MKKFGIFLATFVALLLAIGTVSADTAWWDTNYEYRQQITVNNLAGSTMEASYTVSVDAGLTALIVEGKAKSDLSDVRVVWYDSATGDSTELDRLIDGDNVLFKTQADIPASGSDGDYYIYYGNPSAGTAPADGSNVYMFYDDFENQLGQWTYTSGVSIETSAANSFANLEAPSSCGSEYGAQWGGYRWIETAQNISFGDNYEIGYREISHSYSNNLRSCTGIYIYFQKPVTGDASYIFERPYYSVIDGDCDTTLGSYDDHIRRDGSDIGAEFVWVHSTGIWRDFAIKKVDGAISYIADGVTVATGTDPAPLSNDGSIRIIGVCGHSAPLHRHIDDVKVRRYISPEPTTSLGPEEIADSDGDGVPDNEDMCPETEEGAVVDEEGCSGIQIVANECPADGDYKNHGKYVSCVAHAAEDALAADLITEEEKDAIVSEAAQSDIGKK